MAKRKHGRRATTIYRHNKIRQRFAALGKVTTRRGKQAYTFDKKIEILEKEFGYASDWLVTIICKPMEEDTTLTLF